MLPIASGPHQEAAVRVIDDGAGAEDVGELVGDLREHHAKRDEYQEGGDERAWRAEFFRSSRVRYTETRCQAARARECTATSSPVRSEMHPVPVAQQR